MRYDPSLIEPKWQAEWEKQKAFETPSDLAELKKKPKYYILDMFPYPSGAGLHVGHPSGYTATDVIARLKRMEGNNVLHPMGWDAFGLPAERAALRENIHPAVITKTNIDNFRRQIKRLGFSYDWQREINTSDEDYYKWTQWIFLKLHERGLAYLAEVPVNWCPALCTVLANEEVKDGVYVETGDKVEKRLMKQWMLKITEYAERLLADLDELDWPEGVKEMQRNWIGKSRGLIFSAPVKDSDLIIETFSAHFETCYADTFVVIAPDHPLLVKLLEGVENQSEIIIACKSMLEKRMKAGNEGEKEIEGIFTGRYIVDPLGNGDLPIWVASFAIADYGTGIVKCSAHDERDFAFAKKYNLPLKIVLVPEDKELRKFVEAKEVCFTDMTEGILLEPKACAGKKGSACREYIIDHLVASGFAKEKVSYRLRDWLFSRQRYWGEPMPMVYLPDGTTAPVAESDLPIKLPKVDAYKPTKEGKSPLARADEDWLCVTLPSGEKAFRETNTMPQWAGSCWYYLRYLDPKNTKEFCGAEQENYWMPVDLYIGGVEHAVLHLLYARFWHKVLYDCGLVHTKEPFKKLFNQGMVLAQSYQDSLGKYYYPEDVTQQDNEFVVKSSGATLKTQVEKMSKSKNNVVNPDEVIAEYGADAVRLYELFMGPLEQVKLWQTAGLEGVSRFLNRVWRLVVDEETDKITSNISDAPGPSEDGIWRLLHKTIKKVSDDTKDLKFNTAISQMMMFVNEATALKKIPKECILMFLQVLAPYAPHIAEELWARLGQKDLIAKANWPQFNSDLCDDELINLVVQINGKKRDELKVKRGLPKSEVEAMVMASEKVQYFLEGKVPKKLVVVPDRLVNVVV
ncbi:MAG: leucine--tRNA ligase [bacterium]|nr:leucine--tRNA ligase [bacterium]